MEFPLRLENPAVRDSLREMRGEGECMAWQHQRTVQDNLGWQRSLAGFHAAKTFRCLVQHG